MTMAAAARVNPFPGLVPFEEQESALFFGRDREIEEVLDRLTSRRILAVIGVSGCGKSSLVRAGVVPILRMGVAPNLPNRWQIHTITPGNDPLRALRNALGAPPDWPSTTFDLVDHARNKLQSGESLLLIVDQFEELFRFRKETLTVDGGNAASLFANVLLKAVEQREVPIYLLLTMRTDFLGSCSEFRGLPEALSDCYYLVPRMTRLQQQEAIERPLQEQNASINAALVQRLLNDSDEDPDHLPVLQHLLRRLWENWNGRGADGPISLADYEAVGGWADCLNADAEGVLKQFGPEEEDIRRLFQWITERGTGEKPIRRPRQFPECAEVCGLDREKLGVIIRSFGDRGLLRSSERSDQSLVDLPHESVMWHWLRLKRWISEEAEQATQLRFFLQSAHHQVILTGLTLQSGSNWRLRFAAETHASGRYLDSQELQECVGWIVRSEKRERLKRLRRKLIAGAIVVLAATALALFRIWEVQAENKRKSAEARELSAWAAVDLNDDPERSLILGLYAWGRRRAMVPGLEEFLHRGLTQSYTRRTLSGHQSPVRSIAWSPDGSRVATASDDQTATIWEASTGRELLTLRGHQDGVRSISWSPDGSKLATASADRTAKIWEVSTGHELLTLRGHQGPVSHIAWSPDGRKLATASEDQTAKIWEVSSGRELLTLRGHKGWIWDIAWSPDGKKLATASYDKTAKIWTAASGRELQTLSGHKGELLSIAWSPDGSKLATGSYDHTTKLWDANTWRELQTLRGHLGGIASLAWSPDGSKLATASYDDTGKVWDTDTGQDLQTLRGHKGDVVGITWSPDGSKLATASYGLMAKLWEAGEGHELPLLTGHQDTIRCIVWSPDASKLATVSEDNTARIWEARTGRQLLLLPHADGVSGISWSPDGSKVATASRDTMARIWDAGTGRELQTLQGHQGPIRSVAWSPDGSKLATASDDKTAKVWDAATGRELLTLRGHVAAVKSVAWSPDGSKLATASDDKTAKVWDVVIGRELLTLRGHLAGVVSVAWSPDGSKLATASVDATGKIWDAGTGRELLALRGHRGAVTSITWSPDGKRLATASLDFREKVWDSATTTELLTIRAHQGAVTSIAWSKDGKYLASAGADNIAQVYVLDETELLHLVRSRITRDLRPNECRQFLNAEKCPPLPELP